MKVVNAINTPFPSTVEIHFDQNLLVGNELFNTANYLFNNGAFTTTVEQIDEKKVRVTVENLFENDIFTVTVTDQIKNTSGVGVEQDFNSATFNIAPRNKLIPRLKTNAENNSLNLLQP